MESWLQDIPFEKHSPVRRFFRAALINPLANYLPAGMMKWVLRVSESELAAANWQDPGGWKSMVISYNGRPRQIADKILVGMGSVPMALRNRRRMAGRLIAKLIEEAQARAQGTVHVVGLGAGPGQITIDALLEAPCDARATLVDISADAFQYGKDLAEACGLTERVRYIQGDATQLDRLTDAPLHVVTMLGLCEYIPQDLLVALARSAWGMMPPGAPLVFNSLSNTHGTDRFFRRVFGLHMIHRDPGVICRLFEQAGFGEFTSHREPMGVYHVIVGRRQDAGG